MQLQESGEMYLESIYVLSKRMNHVRSIDVSDYMNFSKPSVSRAVGLLRDNNYLIMDENGFLVLTELGLSVAKKIYERHTILTRALVTLGVPEEIAAEDACKIEHDISDVSFLAIKSHLAKK